MHIYAKLPKTIRWVLSCILLLLVFMTIYRIYFFYHYRVGDRAFSGKTFLLGLRYDLRIVGVLGLSMLLLTLVKPFNPFHNQTAKKIWRVMLSIVCLIFLIFYGSDFFHYDYLQQRLSGSVLGFLNDAVISAKMMWQTYPIVWITLGIALILFIFYRWTGRIFNKIDQKNSSLSKWKIRAIYIISCLLLAIAIFGKLGQYPLRWSDAFSIGDDFKANAALNPFQSFFSTLKYRKSAIDVKVVKRGYVTMANYLGVTEQDSTQLNYTRKINFTDSAHRKPNVVIVICESFSAYKSSMFGNKLNPTPYFNQLSKEGVFFERCFTPGFGTARGVWATLTGIPDVQKVRTASRNPAAVDQHTIINDFTGYDKFYFLGGSTTWANIRGVLNNNIEGLKIFEEDHFNAKKVDVWGISDKNLFLEANAILAKQQKPFISIIQTADNHRPYTIPEQDLGAFQKVEYSKDTLEKYGFDDNGQLNAFRYADFCFKTFIEDAKKQPFFDNTIFVFVGDHGLRGNAGDMFPQSFTKQGILAQHVPLLFYAPKILPAQRIKEVCSQLDVLPTVASLTQQPYTNTTFGRNLFDIIQKTHYAFIADPDLMNMGLISNNYYYSKNLKSGKIDFVSVVDNNPVQNDSAKNAMASLTEIWYQTAQYLLLNNKKKK